MRMSPSDKMTQSSSFLASIAYIGSNILHSDGLSVYKCKKKSSCFVSKHEDLVVLVRLWWILIQILKKYCIFKASSV